MNRKERSQQDILEVDAFLVWAAKAAKRRAVMICSYNSCQGR